MAPEDTVEGEEAPVERTTSRTTAASDNPVRRLFEALTDDPRAAIAGWVIWAAMMVAVVVLGVYHVFYGLFILGYLLAASQIKLLGGWSPLVRRVIEWPGWARFALVFVVALALRWLLLLQDQVITHDLETYVARAELMLDGKLPFLEFGGGTKPPAYQYMLYLMGAAVGPDTLRFRALFSIADAAAAGGVYALCRARFGVGHSLAMGMVYALCPVGIVTIGLSGHYEGVVSLFAIGSLLAFWKGHRNLSAIMLGVAFALKIYPAAMMPFLAIAAAMMVPGAAQRTGLTRWLPTIRYGCLFFVPFLLSLVPLLLMDPAAVEAYFAERGVFIGWGSFTTFFREVMEVTEIGGVDIGYVPLAVIGLMMLMLLVGWARKGPAALRRWTKITLVVLAVHYGIYLSLYFPYYRPANWEWLALAFLLLWFAVLVYVLPRVLRVLDVGTDAELSIERTGLAVVSTLSLTLFMLAMPTLATWYALWPLPFVLAMGTRDTRLVFLWLLLWHVVGVGVSLLPGLPAIN
jgi:hypothetical protein